MQLLSKVGRYEFLAEPFHCDFGMRLFMGHLGNHLLNAADFHSNDRGYGMNALNPIHRTWVLSRLSIEMREMPVSYERFTVETWVESVMRYFTNRNFSVVSHDGNVMGYGRSVWAMIDTQTRQPADIFQINDGLISEYVETDKPCPIESCKRVRISSDTPYAGSVRTHYSDVDVKGHVNSVKYIEHMLDLWAVEWYRSHVVSRIDVAYVAEAYGGDELHFYREQESEGVFLIRTTRKSADNESEVCRCRIVFR